MSRPQSIGRWLVVMVVLSCLAAARTVANRDPVYSVLEPAFEQLFKWTKSGGAYSMEDGGQLESDMRIQSLQAENATLQAQLKLNSKNSFTLSANVVLLGGESYDRTVWIDRGQSDQVNVGDVALANGGLLGLVEQVYDHSAMIKPIGSPGTRTTVKIGNDHALMLVEHGSLMVDLLPKRGQSGKLVATDGLDGQYSLGISVGVLGADVSSKTDVYSKYALELPYNIYEIQHVQIIHKQASKP